MMSGFASLTKCFEGLFDSPLASLPADLQQRVVELSRFLPPWDSLSAEQRLALTIQSDFELDPACEGARENIFNLYCEIADKKAEQIVRLAADELKAVGFNVDHLEIRDRRIIKREQEIERLDAELVSEAMRRWGLGIDMPAGTAARGIRGMAEADAPLVEEILRISAAEKISDTAAALRVVDKATGPGTVDSKLRRLVRRVQGHRTLRNPP
jgi:hypothetical protein